MRIARLLPIQVAATTIVVAMLPATHAQSLPESGAASRSGTVVAQAREATEPPMIDRIVVKGEILSPQNSAFSTTTFDQQDIRDQQVNRLQEMFKFVPGMENRNFQLGGVADAFNLRGFASGGHGGDVGIFIDGIPLNEALSQSDGYADLSVIIPLEIARMTVYRGPVSALFGNFNRGGVIDLRSRKGGEYGAVDVSAGEFKTFDAQGAFGGQLGPAAVNLAAQAYTTDGFRVQSDYQRYNVSGRASFDLGQNGELSFAARAHYSEWVSASYILEPQFRSSDIFGKDPRTMNDGGDKDFATGRVDYNRTIANDTRLGAFGYVTQQTYARYFTRPVSANPMVPWKQRLEDFDRRVYGVGVNLSGSPALFSRPLRYIVGVEGYKERTDFIFQDGLDNRRPSAATLGTEQMLNRRFDFETASAFLQAEWELSRYARPTFGVRYDRFAGDCAARGTEIRPDACGPMNDYNKAAPKFGIRSTPLDWLDWLDLRASYAEGFQLPSGPAKFTPGGAVEPTTFGQLEVGAQFRLASQFLADIAIFRIDSRDEVFLANPSQLLFTNLGKTRREGIEAELRWYPSPAWEFSAALAYLDTEIRESPTPALVGKRVPATPRTVATVQGTWRFLPDFGARATYRHVGNYVLNDSNTLDYGGYNVFDLQLFYDRVRDGKRQRYAVTLNNVADREYATTVPVLAGQRAFSPGAPRSVIASASFDF